MPYPRGNLRPGEEMVLDTRPHWWYVTPAAAALGAAFLLAAVVLAQSPEGTLGDGAEILTGILVLVALGFFANRYAKWVSTNFVVTSDRVIYRSGVFAKKGIEIPVDKINTVFFEQRVLERMLGLGNIKIESASEEGASVFDDIPKPSTVQNIIYGVIDQKSDTSYDRVGQATADAISRTGVGGGAGLSMPEQPEKLHDLKERGAITPEEYEAQKAKLLGDQA
jgi:membrane protein YdbS with pleckstrin-like domain